MTDITLGINKRTKKFKPTIKKPVRSSKPIVQNETPESNDTQTVLSAHQSSIYIPESAQYNENDTVMALPKREEPDTYIESLKNNNSERISKPEAAYIMNSIQHTQLPTSDRTLDSNISPTINHEPSVINLSNAKDEVVEDFTDYVITPQKEYIVKRTTLPELTRQAEALYKTLSKKHQTTHPSYKPTIVTSNGLCIDATKFSPYIRGTEAPERINTRSSQKQSLYVADPPHIFMTAEERQKRLAHPRTVLEYDPPGLEMPFDRKRKLAQVTGIEIEEEEIEPTPPLKESVMAPQARIVHGEIQLDTDSLLVNRNEFNMAEGDQQRSDQDTLHKKGKVVSQWSNLETQIFYDLLTVHGTDFEKIASKIPTKLTKHVKSKWKAELKKFPDKVDEYIHRHL